MKKSDLPATPPADEALRKCVANIVEYWDFSPLQDEDTRIQRLESQILELIKSHAEQEKAAAENQARIDELECHRSKDFMTLKPSGIVLTEEEVNERLAALRGGGGRG